MVASIAHLRIDGDHPLALQIMAYQMRRSRRLENQGNRSERRVRSRQVKKMKR